MLLHLRVLMRGTLDHAVDGGIVMIEVKVSQETATCLLGALDEVLVSDQVPSVAPFRPALGELAHWPVPDEAGELFVALDPARAKEGSPLCGDERQHRADRVAEVAEQENRLRLWVEYTVQPGEVGAAMLRGEVDGAFLDRARGNLLVARLGAPLEEGRQFF